MLNPIHLQTLQSVLRTGSFADAARELGYTASAVSQQISALERHVRMTLFEREAHGVKPTPAALFIGERSLESLGHLRALEDDIGRLTVGTAGRLRIGSFPTASEQLIPRAMSTFVASHPDVDVSLSEAEQDDVIPMLTAGELDIALIYRYGGVPARIPRTFTTQRLISERLVLVVPSGHGLAMEESDISLAGLDAETWISARPGTAGASMLRRLCATEDFEPLVSFRSNNYTAIHGLVAAGLGIAIVPASGFVARDGVRGRFVANSDAVRHVAAARTGMLPEGPWRAFADALRIAAADLAEHAPGVSVPE